MDDFENIPFQFFAKRKMCIWYIHVIDMHMYKILHVCLCLCIQTRNGTCAHAEFVNSACHKKE